MIKKPREQECLVSEMSREKGKGEIGQVETQKFIQAGSRETAKLI